MVENPPASARDIGDMCLIPGLGRCPGEGSGYSLQYSCQENPMDRGTWWAMVRGVAESQHNWSNWAVATGAGSYDPSGADKKKKRQLLGLLHAISPEKREISTYDTESFSSSSLCSPFLHGIYMDMKRARSFCASECLFLFFSASLLTPLKHLQAKFPLFKLCWKSELNVIGGYQMLGFGKILRTSGQFVLCWKDI